MLLLQADVADTATLHLMISADPSTAPEVAEVQKKKKKKTEDLEELLYECEYCKRSFHTGSQLTG